MSETLTLEILEEAMRRLRLPSEDATRPVLTGGGDVCMFIPIGAIAGAIAGGLIEWDDRANGLVLTIRAEGELRRQGAMDIDEIETDEERQQRWEREPWSADLDPREAGLIPDEDDPPACPKCGEHPTTEPCPYSPSPDCPHPNAMLAAWTPEAGMRRHCADCGRMFALPEDQERWPLPSVPPGPVPPPAFDARLMHG